jgi:integrase
MSGCVALTQCQVEQVLSQVTNKRDRALLIVGLYTGFRISELLSLTVGDVIQHGQVVEVLKVQKRNMKGKTSAREVPLNAKAQEAILSLVSVDTNPANPLFQSRNGNAQGNVKALSRNQAIATLKKMFALAQVQGMTGSHVMRKTFAYKIHKAVGFDILKTAAALGHKGGFAVINTARYLPVDQSEVTTAILAA